MIRKYLYDDKTIYICLYSVTKAWYVRLIPAHIIKVALTNRLNALWFKSEQPVPTC